MESFWQSFRADPRVPANAGLRASDADREVVRSLLSEAYADGRLTRAEHDERVAAVLGAVTLGDLPPLVADLTPTTTLVPHPATPLEPAALEEKALAAYRKDLREAWTGFLIPTTICWVVWLVLGLTGGFHFPWPVFVMFSGIPVVTTLVERTEIIEKHRARIEKRERRRLEADQRPELGPGEEDPS